MSRFRKQWLFYISALILSTIFLTSCKTCDCPAYSNVPVRSPGPEIINNTYKNDVQLTEVSAHQTLLIS